MIRAKGAVYVVRPQEQRGDPPLRVTPNQGADPAWSEGANEVLEDWIERARKAGRASQRPFWVLLSWEAFEPSIAAAFGPHRDPLRAAIALCLRAGHPAIAAAIALAQEHGEERAAAALRKATAIHGHVVPFVGAALRDADQADKRRAAGALVMALALDLAVPSYDREAQRRATARVLLGLLRGQTAEDRVPLTAEIVRGLSPWLGLPLSFNAEPAALAVWFSSQITRLRTMAGEIGGGR